MFKKNSIIKWLCIFLLTLASWNALAQSREYQIKAVFLLNFAQFTQWPSNAFAKANSPMVIGVLGGNPFGSALNVAVKDETMNGHKFVVRHFRRLEDVQDCHILFISQSETQHLEKIISNLKEKPILTVSDIEESPARGVCIGFITANNKIQLMINTNSVKDADLTLSSKLLGVAQICR